MGSAVRTEAMVQRWRIPRASARKGKLQELQREMNARKLVDHVIIFNEKLQGRYMGR